MANYARMFLAGVVCFGFLSVSDAQGLADYQNNIFGLHMRIPAGMAFSAVSQGQGGWSGFTGTKQIVTIIARRKDTLFSEPNNMMASLVVMTGIPANFWTLVDQENDQRGWTKFRTLQANDGKNIVFAIVGTGTARSYMIILSTTVKEYQANKAVYDVWYASVTLVPVIQPEVSTPTPPATQPAQTQSTPLVTQPAQSQSTGVDTVQTTPASQPASPAAPKKQPKTQKAKYQ